MGIRKTFLKGMALGMSLKGLGEANYAMKNAQAQRGSEQHMQNLSISQILIQETASHSTQLGQLKGLSAGDMVNSITSSYSFEKPNFFYLDHSVSKVRVLASRHY